MSDIHKALADIVGKEYVSTHSEERYFYARDPGLMPPHDPDYVVMPRTTEEVQKIVLLANQHRIPVVPKGGGLALTGLVIPLKGGILLDMKRMDKILEVNEGARYVIIEGGTSQGALKAYLDKHHPSLRHCMPEAPPIATIVGNVLIHGQGRLTQQYGFTSDMVTGMEVVLPTGEVCNIGSCSISPYWFSKGAPLPDLSGLFLGWFGASGIITKMGFRLYPRKKLRDLEIFVTDRAELIPDIIFKITHTEMVEDLTVWSQPFPLMFKGNHHINISLNGDTDEELEFKIKLLWKTLQPYINSGDGGFMLVVPGLKQGFLEIPQKNASRLADLKKGGGFEYAGIIIPVEKYPDCILKLAEIASKHRLTYSGTARIIGRSNCMMFTFSYAFNRADPNDMDRVRQAWLEAGEFALGQGGIPWKAPAHEQKMILQRMDPNTRKLMKRIKDTLDPNGIMNPGNWEAE